MASKYAKWTGIIIVITKKNIDFDTIYSSTVPWIFGENFLTDNEQVTLFKKILLDNPFPQSLENQVRQYRVLSEFDGRGLGEKIKSPTLVGYGDEDLVSLPHEVERLAKTIPNSKLIGIPGAHGVTIDAPQELVNILTDFL